MFQIAKWLKKRGGFWYPAIKRFLLLIFPKCSLGYYLNTKFKRKSLGGPWVSEIYLCLGGIVGLIWIAVIDMPVPTSLVPVLTSLPCRVFFVILTALSIFISFYRVLEILLFSLHWLLVAKKPVESYGRSLLGFIFNLFEVGILFAFVYILFSLFDPPQDKLSALLKSVSSVFSLETISGLSNSRWPQILALLQLLISWLLVVTIVANVVGSIHRGEKKTVRFRHRLSCRLKK